MTADQATNQADWTISRLLSWTAEYLERVGVDDARLSAEVLLAHAAACRRIDLYARFDQGMGAEATAKFRELVKRAAGHEPIAYLVGQKEFFSLPFTVTSDVLIPRSETELLVECVIDHCVKRGLTEPKLLDLGTGSGCIAIAVATQNVGARVVATDVSPAALEVARGNAERHEVADRVTLVEADGLSLPGESVPDGGFDVLMSNPPYIAVDEVAGLDANVRDHEPRVALTDGGDGLSFYRMLAEGGRAVLADGGVVVVEVADGLAEPARRVFEEAGGFEHDGTWKDRVVGRERVLMFSAR